MNRLFRASVKFLGLALILLCGKSHAAPFDKTGLIDLKNEGSTRGSCAAVGSVLQLATSKIYTEILRRPAQGPDAQWKNQQDVQRINKFGENGSYWSNVLQRGMGEHVPPSQFNDFIYASTPSQRLFGAIEKDPWIAVHAWNYCGKIYGFSK